MPIDVAPGPAVPANHPAALAELETLVAQMKGGPFPLEGSSLEGFVEGDGHGRGLLPFCRARLEAFEQRFEVREDGPSKPWSSQA